MTHLSSRTRHVLTLGAVCLGTFMLIIDVQIVVVALPSIRSSLGASLAEQQWTIDAYSLALAALLLPAGSLADALGRRRLFAGGLAAFTIGSLLCGLAWSGVALLLFRALQGVGGAVVFAVSLALLVQTFQGRSLGVAIGIWSAVVNLGLGCGPVVGGLLAEVSWRWIFFVNLPIGAIAVAMTLIGVDEHRAADARRVDLVGGGLFSVGLIGLIFALIESTAQGWTDPRVVLALAVAVVALTAFPLVELRRREPMVDLRLLRTPTFVGGLVAALGMNGSLYAVLLYLVLFLQDGLRYSPLETGLRLLVVTAAATAMSLLAGRLSARVPLRLLVGSGLLIIGVGLLLMTGLDGQTPWTHLIVGLVVAGVGSGLVNPPLASTAVGVVAPDAAGMASGINATFRQIGIAVSVAVLGGVFANRLAAAGGGRAGHAAALDDVLVIAGGVAAVAGVLALLLIRSRDFRVDGSRTELEPSLVP